MKLLKNTVQARVKDYFISLQEDYNGMYEAFCLHFLGEDKKYKYERKLYKLLSRFDRGKMTREEFEKAAEETEVLKMIEFMKRFYYISHCEWCYDFAVFIGKMYQVEPDLDDPYDWLKRTEKDWNCLNEFYLCGDGGVYRFDHLYI